MTTPTILLVDDDSDLLQVIGQRCRSLGLDVLHARNLLTATAVIERQVPDIVCVDVQMPTGNGLRFCETLYHDPRTAHVPIIVLTGQQDAATIQACRQVDAHYLFKTADIWASLEPLVRQLLPPAATDRTPTTAGIRPQRLSAHAIPPWPGEADAGNQNNALAIKSLSAVTRQVVIADDDTDLVRLLSQRFSSIGCSAFGVNGALEAINAIHRLQPELVVLDVNMPSGNGLSVCEMMATDQRLRTIPIIILTGQSDESTIRRCHDLLVFYVQKGANIWSRIEPLVYELLRLGDAPTPPGQSSEESSDEVLSGEGDRDTLMDAVFAMLGAEADSTAEAGAAGKREVVDVPWVLVVDDDSDFSDALKIRLEDHGVAVARASNGMEGYRLAFVQPASAILLDYNMPNGQGDYILGRLKDNPVTKGIPVFMITGVKDKMLERRVLAMGAAEFIEKPVNFDSLRTRLANHIDILARPGSRLAAANR